MVLRCLLFTSDEVSAEPILNVLEGLGVEAEHCAAAVDAVERVTQQSFQIVIIDWEVQPEAGLLLKAARERKAGERPLTLAIVSDDAGVPQALQAGANSILRKPILVNQVKDTLTTARDLLRAKLESAAAAAQAAVAGASAAAATSLPANLSPAAGEKTLRAGEFLQSSAPAPGTQFVTETDATQFGDQPAEGELDALADLEPVASALPEQKPVPPPATLPDSGEPRGLQWYLNARAGGAPKIPAQARPPAPAAPAAGPKKLELLGFEQTTSYSPPEPSIPNEVAAEAEPEPKPQPIEPKPNDQVFSYASEEGEPAPDRPTFRLGRGALLGAFALAACAIVAAPQAPWHPTVRKLWGRGQTSLHAWLNPQPVTSAPAPAAHEDFARAGDEYKLPVAENIPDATTDPSQIRVTPVVDPTAKKTDNAAANPDQSAGDPSAAPPDGASANPGDPSKAPAIQVQDNPVGTAAVAAQPANASPNPTTGPAAGATSTNPAPPAVVSQPPSDIPANAPVTNPITPPKPQLTPQRPAQVHAVSSSATSPIPSSLKSQMASMTPEASGNKPAESAMPSIEPVDVPEATERGLLTDQPPIAYPDNAKGQQGTVVIQVLIGRDGTVQDAKFLQGSLAFARTAIDGVKQWKFKPYAMNGRAVSVQTNLTMSFKP
jgi:protein TonB